jgi:kynurenine 3-monooxygenase
MGTRASSDKITLIGAGLAGSLLAIYLAKRGIAVEVYERRPDMRKVKISAGRSINLALSTRGIHALKEVGLSDEVMKFAIPMKGRMIHSTEGELQFIPYGKDDSEVIYSVPRGRLNMILMNAAEKHRGVRIHFNEKCTGFNFKSGELCLVKQDSGESYVISSNTVIGADGSASAIRMSMSNVGRFNFSQQPLEHGYKELTIPPTPDGEFQLEKNALHIWPRHTFMLIALPNWDGSFTCTLFNPFEGEFGFEELNTEGKVLNFFEKQFPDAVPLIPTLLEDFFSNPTGSLVTIKCYPWHVNGQALLLGDAAHAIVPFFGQGMNCAFEDCTYLNDCIGKHSKDWEEIFREFEKLRKANTDAIADMALENYIEMRDHVIDAKFLLRKQIEFELEKRYPKVFIPRYSMVSFHRIPYSIARSRGKIQEKILAELCQSVDNIEDLDWGKAASLIKKELMES